MNSSIPFNRPARFPEAAGYIADAFARGKVSGDGHYTRACNGLIESEVGCARAMLTTSCTHALEMAALLLDLRPGDEFICPAFTFSSTANAFVLRGARPVFVDSRPDTLNMDERLIAGALTPRTKAIVAMHYGGVACRMDEILAPARRQGIRVLENNAHGLFGRRGGKPLGSLGDIATLSFHETKNFTCGEGGALLINDARYAARAEIIREKGTNRSLFFRGEVAKYTWVDIGSSYLPSEILAAELWSQLEHRGEIQSRRRRIWERYHAALAGWAGASGVGRPHIPDDCEPTHHVYYLLLPSLAARTAFIAHLNARRIAAAFHYMPLHVSEVGRRLGGRPGQCPVAERAGDCLARLPLYYDLSDEDQQRVIEAAISFRP